MNDICSGTAVALTGMVPCKVIGPVKKGDIIVNSSIEGTGTRLLHNADWQPGCVIGKSLEDDNNTGIRIILVVVGRF
jgi:hypothetical protein